MNPSHALRYAQVALLAIGAALIGACASGPKVYADKDPGADFARYRTYAFEPVLGTDDETYSSILSQYLKTAVGHELEARGYTYSDSPDLLVNFRVRTNEKIQSDISVGVGMSGYFGYRRGYYGVWSGYPAETRVTQYTEGTLNVDLVDAARKQLVWEGTIIGRVREEHRANLQQTVDQAVSAIFARYPYRAGSAQILIPPEKK